MGLAAVISQASRVTDPNWRVALVSTQRLWHGGELQLALLAEGLRAHGHSCLILARRGGQLAERLTDRGLDVKTFAGRARLPHALWQIRRQLRRFRPQILHFNDPHALQAAGLASWGLPIQLRVAARRVDFPLRSVFSYRRWCDGVICVSRAVRQVCVEAGLPAERLPVVHDGVDPRRLQQGQRRRGRTVLGLSEEVPLLLTVAKLTDHKGHRYLLDALPAVLQRFPQTVLAWRVTDLCCPSCARRPAGCGWKITCGSWDSGRTSPTCWLPPICWSCPPTWRDSAVPSSTPCSPAARWLRPGPAAFRICWRRRPDNRRWAGWSRPATARRWPRAVLDGLQSPPQRRRMARQAQLRARRDFSAVTMVDRTLKALERLLQLRQPSQDAVRTTSATSELVSEMSRTRSAC